MNDPSTRRSWLRDLLLLTFAIGALFLFGLGQRPVTVTSEARYAEIPREMVHDQDWVTPHLNGVKYFEKPPLFYWVQAAFYQAFGYGDEFRVRLATVLFSLIGCLITYVAGRLLYDRGSGVFAALTLATSALWYGLSRVVLTDIPVAVFLALTLFAFIIAVRAGAGRQRDIWLYVMYAAAAGAVMTKGLIGMALPGLVVLVWLALTGQWSLLKEVRLISGTVLFLVLVVPWHWLAANRNHDFIQFYFWHEHVERFLTTEHNRYQPPWFFIAIFAAGWLPWLPLLPQAAVFALKGTWRDRRTDGTGLFLALTIGLITLFFSLSDSKLPPYIAPVFPATAVLLGRYLYAAYQNDRSFRFRNGAIVHHLLFPLVGVVAAVAASVAGGKVRAALDNAGDVIIDLNIAMGLATLALVVLAFSRRRGVWVAGMVAASALLCVMLNQIGGRMVDNSVKPLALDLKTRFPADVEVVAFHDYFQDLPFYLDRTVSVVNWLGELEFGTKSDPTVTRRWMYDNDEFWRRWTGDKRMVAVMRREAYDGLRRDPARAGSLHFLGATDRVVAVTNQALP